MALRVLPSLLRLPFQSLRRQRHSRAAGRRNADVCKAAAGRAAIVALSLVAIAVAGCTATGPTTSDDGGDASLGSPDSAHPTALQSLPAARALADAWHPDAALALVAGYERTGPHAPGGGPFSSVDAADDGRLDGRAPAWVYVFGPRDALTTGSRASDDGFWVLIEAGQEARGQEGELPPIGMPLDADALINSDAAAQAVRAHPFFDHDLGEEPDVTYNLADVGALGGNQGPEWRIVVRGDQGDDRTWRVNAHTGEVSGVE